MSDETWAVVIPDPRTLKDTARLLLDLAGDPSLVETTSGGTAFRVPQDVAAAFDERLSAADTPAPKKTTTKRRTAPRASTEE